MSDEEIVRKACDEFDILFDSGPFKPGEFRKGLRSIFIRAIQAARTAPSEDMKRLVVWEHGISHSNATTADANAERSAAMNAAKDT